MYITFEHNFQCFFKAFAADFFCTTKETVSVSSSITTGVGRERGEGGNVFLTVCANKRFFKAARWDGGREKQ